MAKTELPSGFPEKEKVYETFGEFVKRKRKIDLLLYDTGCLNNHGNLGMTLK